MDSSGENPQTDRILNQESVPGLQESRGHVLRTTQFDRPSSFPRLDLSWNVFARSDAGRQKCEGNGGSKCDNHGKTSDCCDESTKGIRPESNDGKTNTCGHYQDIVWDVRRSSRRSIREQHESIFRELIEKFGQHSSPLLASNFNRVGNWECFIIAHEDCSGCYQDTYRTIWEGVPHELNEHLRPGRAEVCGKCGSSCTGIREILYKFIPPCSLCDFACKAQNSQVRLSHTEEYNDRFGVQKAESERRGFSEMCRGRDDGEESSEGRGIINKEIGFGYNAVHQGDRGLHEGVGSELEEELVTSERNLELMRAFIEDKDVKIQKAGQVMRGKSMVATAPSRSQLVGIVIQKEWANEGRPVSKPWDIVFSMNEGLTIGVVAFATTNFKIKIENDSKQAVRDDATWAAMEIIKRAAIWSRQNGQWKASWLAGDILQLFSKNELQIWERKVMETSGSECKYKGLPRDVWIKAESAGEMINMLGLEIQRMEMAKAEESKREKMKDEEDKSEIEKEVEKLKSLLMPKKNFL
jgi:hypothetical protein